ncbi:MAG: hypothetical protein M0P61_04305 [Ignavibacteriaceae bacterium]|jgi:hypothetical protein|nr:hypothetical protein [Ignavibacteriaceae bacterium]
MPESTYTISPTLNKNKIFLLQKSEVEKSLSPLYYSSFPMKISHSKKLKEIAFINLTRPRPRPKFESEDLVPYVGLPEIDEHPNPLLKLQ